MGFTVVTWLWDGWNPIYGPEDVHRLKRKLEQHMSVPFRFVCVADEKFIEDLECETFPMWEYYSFEEDTERRERILDDHVAQLAARGIRKPREELTPTLPNCYHRLRLFDPEVGKQFGDYVLSLDLDVEIFDDLAPMLSLDDDFKIMQGLSRAPYCGTMWWLKTGCFPEVWSDLDPAQLVNAEFDGRPLVGSDQAWLSVKLPDMPTWANDGSDGGYYIRRLVAASSWARSKKPDNCRIVFAAGRIKTRSPECRMMIPWLYESACSP